LVTHTSGLVKDAPVGYWDSGDFPPVERVMALLAETEQPYPPHAVEVFEPDMEGPAVKRVLHGSGSELERSDS
jgi:hypothetical protein